MSFNKTCQHQDISPMRGGLRAPPQPTTTTCGSDVTLHRGLYSLLYVIVLPLRMCVTFQHGGRADEGGGIKTEENIISKSTNLPPLSWEHFLTL